MPGASYRGELPPLTKQEHALADELKRDVTMMAVDYEKRNTHNPDILAATATFIHESFREPGYAPEIQQYAADGVSCQNIAVNVTGSKADAGVIVVGAHYDAEPGSPGANDNASGTSALLALARRFVDSTPRRTLRFVAFVNEEPPWFQTDRMGNVVYARRCKKEGEQIVAMIALETIGYYSVKPYSQNYPFPLNYVYPSRGNFFAVVGDLGSRTMVREVMRCFRKNARFPSQGGAFPASFPGVGWSDHWSFWKFGYPAVMLTDTAPFRYPHYHAEEDTPHKIDYEKTARVVAGLERVIREMTI